MTERRFKNTISWNWIKSIKKIKFYEPQLITAANRHVEFLTLSKQPDYPSRKGIASFLSLPSPFLTTADPKIPPQFILERPPSTPPSATTATPRTQTSTTRPEFWLRSAPTPPTSCLRSTWRRSRFSQVSIAKGSPAKIDQLHPSCQLMPPRSAAAVSWSL